MTIIKVYKEGNEGYAVVHGDKIYPFYHKLNKKECKTIARGEKYSACPAIHFDFETFKLKKTYKFED